MSFGRYWLHDGDTIVCGDPLMGETLDGIEGYLNHDADNAAGQPTY